ncbi:MAG: helix-turn-helix transcriptional regulator [Lachnospiraceae bacterium]|nr:helix-turn-helix transcriptional regulator [Lachnospiraceae bacterium]
MIMDDVSARVCEILEERGISKYDLSKRCPDVARSSVYNVAKGSKRATIVTLDSICRGLGISLKDFFDWRADLDMILKDDERVTIEGIRSLDTEQQARLQGYLKALLEEKKK